MYNIELTDYQKTLIKESAGGKWFYSKTILITLVLDILLLASCYAIFMPEGIIKNWGGAGLVVYVVWEVLISIIFGITFLIAKLVDWVKRKEGLEETQGMFKSLYKILPIGQSLTYYLVDLIIDIAVFVTLVLNGWIITSTIHAVAVVFQQKTKPPFYRLIIRNLKAEAGEEKEETIDELSDKLFNG